MREFIETVKQIAVKAVESQKPMQMVYGTVLSLSPLQIQLGLEQIYTKEFFWKLDTAGDLQEGDKLILLRVQGGQQYLILGKGGGL